MKRPTLQILHRYRKYLLGNDQIVLQQKIADEKEQQNRLVHLKGRVRTTHEAKLRATVVEELCSTDESAAYLHSRMTMARRAIALTTQAREDAVQKTLQTKKECDQIEALLEKERRDRLRAQDAVERRAIDELVTSRYAMTRENL